MGTGSGNNFQPTPIMGLPLPIPGVCGALGIEPAGRSWLELLNAGLSILDQHNHTGPGFGANIPAQALSIGADVNWNGNNILGLRSTRYGAISLGSLTVADRGCIVISGADLYYVDTNGNQIRLTSGGGIVGSPGTITGLVSPAAATYTPASKLFQFTSSPGFAANLSCGPLSIGDAQTNGGNAVIIGVVSGLAANYNLTLPTALPGSNSLLALSTAGQMSAFGTVSGNSLTLSGLATFNGAIAATGMSTFSGGSGNNSAISATGTGTGRGLVGTGGATNAEGVVGNGGGSTGPGGSFFGASGGGNGLNATAGTGGKAATFTGGVVDLGSQKINNVADPTSAQDAATKNYVDSHTKSTMSFGATASSLGVTAYAWPGGQLGTVTSTEGFVKHPMPFAGTAKNLFVSMFSGSTAGVITAMVRKNGADTGLTCATSIGGTSANDTTHSFTFAQGDLISVSVADSGGTAAATHLEISFELDS